MPPTDPPTSDATPSRPTVPANVSPCPTCHSTASVCAVVYVDTDAADALHICDTCGNYDAPLPAWTAAVARADEAEQVVAELRILRNHAVSQWRARLIMDHERNGDSYEMACAKTERAIGKYERLVLVQAGLAAHSRAAATPQAPQHPAGTGTESES
jgi:hypothetical protein